MPLNSSIDGGKWTLRISTGEYRKNTTMLPNLRDFSMNTENTEKANNDK